MLKEIVGQISQIRKQLSWEVVAGHPLLNVQWLEIESDLHLARLLLLSAKLNQYDFAKLKPVAVALELLNLAVKRHYRLKVQSPKSKVQSPKAEVRGQTSDIRHPTSDINLALIAGDYYYAKALAIVAVLKDSLVIEILSRAIGNVAEGEANGAEDVQLKKRASLYVAACQLGAYLSGNSSSITKALMDYGQNFGIVCEIRAKGNDSRRAQNFFQLAEEALFSLPKSSYRKQVASVLSQILNPSTKS